MLYELKLVCFAVASALILSLPATASDLEKQIPVKFETLAMRQTSFSGQRIAIYGRISMRFEDTTLDSTCTYSARKGRSKVTGSVRLMLFDEVAEYTDKEGKQYRDNLHRYSSLHHKCAWVVGVFSPNDSVDENLSIRDLGTLKRINYVGKRYSDKGLPPR